MSCSQISKFDYYDSAFRRVTFNGFNLPATDNVLAAIFRDDWGHCGFVAFVSSRIDYLYFGYNVSFWR